MAYTIEALGLRKAFGTTQVLDGLDLCVEAGQVFALLGPNGAGKTTTVRILTTLLAPDAGSARVARQPSRLAPSWRSEGWSRCSQDHLCIWPRNLRTLCL